MKTHKFARKPFYVDAVRVSETNIEEVAQWCDGIIEDSSEGKFIRVKVHRPLTERQTQAFIGDWVLFAGSGFKVYVPKAFDKSFEKVKHLTKAQADEAGIKVPHEKSQKPKQAPPRNPVLTDEKAKVIRDARIVSISLVPENKAMPEARIESVSPPRSKADEEADKLIAEVERIRNS